MQVKKRFFIQTYGCQMNVHDTEYMASLLEKAGYVQTRFPQEADIYLINTCAVRQKAEEKVYSLLGRLKFLKRKRPNLIIGVGGCVAQKEAERIMAKMPHVDLVFGTHQIYRLLEFIEKIREKKERICCIDFNYELEPPCDLFPIPRESSVRAYITIMQGCNNFCTYCIVPYVRGREVSRKSEQILAEAQRLIDRGVKEIILLGQNVNSYGQDRTDEISFPELLRRLDKLPGLKRLRFITSHPKDISPELIQAFGELETLCEQIHLPVQSGSDRILKRMGRKYTRSDYLRKIEALRKVCPNIAITTDLIVGFPGETDADFRQTLSLLEEVQFDAIFAFKYSDRPPAKAVSFPDKIDEKTKAERLTEVLNLQKPITEKKNKAKEGKILEVLLDTHSKRNPDQVAGRTRCNRIVNVQAGLEFIGKLVEVKTKEALPHSLRGEVVKVLG
ncbi:MAG: tRNA (N6-isopentenyl adenosine(37)-C2)-methylthiotransferase MiaB [Candidatus Desulfofervidaceae bacterium]|nr:tRNA (N6-isopentenyl adenosine(37)-C2)-methylthiotransferase MiaB [Candidatus Desulfofervidaceae bacterium]